MDDLHHHARGGGGDRPPPAPACGSPAASTGAGHLPGTPGVLSPLEQVGRDVVAIGRRATREAPSPSLLVDLVHQLECLANQVAGVQLDLVRELTERQRDADAARGVDPEVTDRALASMIGLARRQSPHRGARDRNLAMVLRDELPSTRQALLEGRASVRQAELMAEHTVFLSREDRTRVDAELGPRLQELSTRALAARASHRAYALDPKAYTDHAGLEHRQRRVTMRPRPNTMALLSAYLPAVDAVRVWSVLEREARTLRAQGDGRSLDQLRADVLVQRVTGQAEDRDLQVELQVVMPAASAFGAEAVRDAMGAVPDGSLGTDQATRKCGNGALRASEDLADGEGRAGGGLPADGGRAGGGLTAGGDEAAGWLAGYGPLPAPMARGLVRRAGTVRLRRLLTEPVNGTIVERDVRRRTFSPGDRQLLLARDRTCRTPFCDAPIREADHVQPWARGGSTSPDNGQGLCQHCNNVKNHPEWTSGARTTPLGDQEEVITTTPTGHGYASPVPRAGW